MRADPKDAAEVQARRVSSGVYSIAEVRRLEQLPYVPYSDEPRLQAQQVPLSQASLAALPSAPSAPVGEKAYADAVQRDLAALTLQARKRPERAVRQRQAPQSASHEQQPIIRKTKRDALVRGGSGKGC